MALCLGQDSAATIHIAQGPNGQVIGEGPGGQKDGPLLAEFFSHPLLELRDHAAVGVVVLLHVAARCDLCQDARILPSIEVEAVAVEKDGACGFELASRRGDRRSREAEAGDASRTEPDEVSPVHVTHVSLLGVRRGEPPLPPPCPRAPRYRWCAGLRCPHAGPR